MNAVIYARYSSHNQRDESIEGQLRECHAFAAANGLTVIHEYCDRALSGTTDNRPEFQQLIEDSRRGQFQAVIMYTLDRFARNRYDSAIYKSKLKKNGVRIYYAKQPLPEGPESIILESVLEGYAEYYSENLSRNIKRGLMENALQGIAPGGNCMPLGYQVGPDRKHQIEPVGAAVVRDIFQKYADGIPVSRIITYCNEKGYKTIRGGSFNKNSLKTLLKNEAYIGTYRFMGVTMEHTIPPIIDKDLFERVQETISRNAKTKARAKAHEDYLLTGTVFCGHCNSPMVGESGTSKTGKFYHYYTCISRKRKRICSKRPEKKAWLEELVVRTTVEKVLTDENIDLIATRAMEIIQRESADTRYLTGLENQLRDVVKKITNITDAIEQGIFTASTKDRLLALEGEKENLELQIAQAKMKKPVLTKEHIIFWLSRFKDGNVSDPAFCRKIIDALVHSIYVYDNDGDNGRKITILFNTSANNKVTLASSDIEWSAPPIHLNPNSLFSLNEHVFGFSISIRT